MPRGQDKRDELLGPLFEAAETGNDRAARSLMRIASGLIKDGHALGPRLRGFFAKVLEDPARYAEIMTFKPKKPRGRPSIDRDTTAEAVGLEHRQRFGARPTESNALAIHHLLLQGHVLNEASKTEKESAVVLMNELTGRSARSLQADYAKHKQAILGMGPQSAARSAGVAYRRLVSLAEFRRIYGKTSRSQ